MIIDARLCNAIAGVPPGVALCTSEALSAIEVTGEEEDDETMQARMRDWKVYFGTSDVADCFHRFILPETMSDLFVLDVDFTAAELGLTGQTVQGVQLSADSPVWAACRALPMGFSWSLFLLKGPTNTSCRMCRAWRRRSGWTICPAAPL